MEIELSRIVNAVGLIFDIIGVVMLWRFGLPQRINEEGREIAVYNESDETKAVARRFKKLSLTAVCLIVFGFSLQLASDLVPECLVRIFR